jgi:aspartyl-tRNA(Asn)/glutamyl-tRNA(Gln) amidotransferase subunit B
MRSKEEAHDYRYFPEPDLPPFEITKALLEKVNASLPELPLERFDRFIRDYGLTEYEAEILTSEREIADFYEQCASSCGEPKEASKWIQTSVLKELNDRDLKIRDLKVSPEQVGALIVMVQKNRISHQAARKIFAELADQGGDPEELVKKMGLEQVSDTSVLEEIIREVLTRCAPMVEEYKGGKEKALNALMGQVMKASKGKANPGLVRSLLMKTIKDSGSC